MNKYREKSPVFEAIQTDGTVENANLIREWSDGFLRDHWMSNSKPSKDKPYGDVAFYIYVDNGMPDSGQHETKPGDWLIKHADGKFTYCVAKIFRIRYEFIE